MTEEDEIRPDLRTRQGKAAQAYMERKGYKDLRPHDVLKIEGVPCWYFYYRLPEGGLLELEVFWEDTETGTQWRYATMHRVESEFIFADT